MTAVELTSFAATATVAISNRRSSSSSSAPTENRRTSNGARKVVELFARAAHFVRSLRGNQFSAVATPPPPAPRSRSRRAAIRKCPTLRGCQEASSRVHCGLYKARERLITVHVTAGGRSRLHDRRPAGRPAGRLRLLWGSSVLLGACVQTR